MTEISPIRDVTAYLTRESIEGMIGAEPEFRNKLLVQILFRGGMRVSELCGDSWRGIKGAQVQDILWEEKCILVPWLKRRREGGKPVDKRKVPIDSTTLQMLKEYLKGRKRGNIFPFERRMAYLIVRKAAERIGIKEVGDPDVGRHRAGSGIHRGHHPHPHLLRHSYGTVRARASKGDYMELRRIQLAMGHRNIGTTAIYLDVSSEELHIGYDAAFEEGESGKA